MVELNYNVIEDRASYMTSAKPFATHVERTAEELLKPHVDPKVQLVHPDSEGKFQGDRINFFTIGTFLENLYAENDGLTDKLAESAMPVVTLNLNSTFAVGAIVRTDIGGFFVTNSPVGINSSTRKRVFGGDQKQAREHVLNPMNFAENEDGIVLLYNLGIVASNLFSERYHTMGEYGVLSLPGHVTGIAVTSQPNHPEYESPAAISGHFQHADNQNPLKTTQGALKRGIIPRMSVIPLRFLQEPEVTVVTSQGREHFDITHRVVQSSVITAAMTISNQLFDKEAEEVTNRLHKQLNE